MVLRMTRPTRRKTSSNLQFRKRVPKDILDKARGKKITLSFPREDDHHKTLLVPVTISSEIKVSLRTNEPDIAKRRSASAEEQLQKAWVSIRQGPIRLTQKETVSLAGLCYGAIASAFENNPGSPDHWEEVLELNKEAFQGKFGVAANFNIGFSKEQKQTASLEERFGGFVDATLQKQGLIVDQHSRMGLLLETGKALNDAAVKLKRNAQGDYSSDKQADRFPTWQKLTQQPADNDHKTKSLSLTELYTGWKHEAEASYKAVSTIDDYKSRIGLFRKFLGHDDAVKVTADDIVKYKDYRLTIVSPKTVKDSDLVTLKSVFGWAVRNRKLETNPAIGITLKIAHKPQVRSKGILDVEAKALLEAALAYKGRAREADKITQAKKWLPWLCAYSGARVGEMAQLRKQDICRVNDIWVLKITPDAGTVKNKKARDVPIHNHVLDIGFLDFVTNSQDGHLFLNIPAGSDVFRAINTTKNRLREFVRTVITDTNVHPNHGWRHRFKTLGREAGIDSAILDAICGHAPANVGAHYGDYTVKALADAIKKFPRQYED